MKKYLNTITKILSILLIAAGYFMIPESAHAALFGISSIALPVINESLAAIGNAVLTVTSYLVTAAGLFLSISINITLHIKDFYEGIPAIKQIWVIVRDLSSMFIIFTLLYYSILTIVGQAEGKVKDRIVKVFLAGIFINFSLFFVRVGVDASNLVSLQFYNAIAPETSTNFTVNSAFYDGGLSNIFLQSLKIQKVYGMASTHQGLEMGSIFFSTIGGIIIMVTAAISIFAAALAFAARTAIILFVMALSPLYFAGFIFPEIKAQVSDRLMKLFKGQLIFMPVYLFLIYVALRVLSDGGFGQIFGQTSTTAGATNSLALAWGGLFVQYTIAILFINIPLVAAIGLSGEAGKLMKWAPQADAVSKRIGGFFGRNTLGRASRRIGAHLDKADAEGKSFGSEGLHKFGSSILRATRIAPAVRSTLEKGEKGKYGSPYNLESLEGEDKKYRQQMGELRHQEKVKNDFDAKFSNTATTHDEFKNTLSKMNQKEVEGLKEKLGDKRVAAALSTKQAENILKSDISESDKDKFRTARLEGLKDRMRETSSGDMENILKEDFDEQQKKELKNAREEVLKGLVENGDLIGLPEYMRKLSGKELSKMKKELITDELVIANLKKGQLIEMENMDEEVIKKIGNSINNWLGFHHKNHPAYDHINKNRSMWTG